MQVGPPLCSPFFVLEFRREAAPGKGSSISGPRVAAVPVARMSLACLANATLSNLEQARVQEHHVQFHAHVFRRQSILVPRFDVTPQEEERLVQAVDG